MHGEQSLGMLLQGDVDDCIVLFTNLLLDVARQFIPQKVVFDMSASHPWLDNKCRRLIAEKGAARGFARVPIGKRGQAANETAGLASESARSARVNRLVPSRLLRSGVMGVVPAPPSAQFPLTALQPYRPSSHLLVLSFESQDYGRDGKWEEGPAAARG